MGYIENFKQGFNLVCTHPKVKSISHFGSASMEMNTPMFYNIKVETVDGVELIESGENPDLVKDRMEEILSKL